MTTTEKVSTTEMGRAVKPRSSQIQRTRYSEKLSAAKAEPRKPELVCVEGDHRDLGSRKKGIDQDQDDLDQQLYGNS